MASALVTALTAPLLELQNAVGSGSFRGDDPAAILSVASRILADVATEGTAAANEVDSLWSGSAADSAAQAMSTAVNGASELATAASGMARQVVEASDAVVRAKADLQRIIDEFEATAAALERDLPESAGAIVDAARRALSDANRVVGELEAELDGHAAAVAESGATTPATSPAGLMSSLLPAAAGLPSTASGLASGLLGTVSPATDAIVSLLGGTPGLEPANPQATIDALGSGVTIQLPDGSTAVAPNEVAADAVRHALTQLGVPYQWGGTTPGVALDCSGLTQWAYHEAGLNLPRMAQDQDIGAAVSPGALMPGDLAVWDGHVAMIVGNGIMVEAGDPVKLSPIRTTNLGQGFQGFWRPTS